MIALLSLLLLASDTPAETPPASPAPAAEAPKAERKICRREEATESRLGAKRICLTAAQWQARNNGGGDGRGANKE